MKEEKLKLDYMITTMLMELGATVLGVKNKLNFLGLWTIFSRQTWREDKQSNTIFREVREVIVIIFLCYDFSSQY